MEPGRIMSMVMVMVVMMIKEKKDLLVESNGSKRLRVIPLDVTKPNDVEAAVAQIRQSKLPLWAVVNNAGIAIGCPFDWGKDIDVYQKTFDVNVFGVVRVTNRCLPLLRQSKGRVINVASVAGRLTVPIMSHYCMAKHSVRVFSDVLRRELYNDQIEVVTIEPTFYKTPIVDFNQIRRARERIYEETPNDIREAYSSKYISSLNEVGKLVNVVTRKDVGEVIDTMMKAVTLTHPKAFYRCCGYHDVVGWAVSHLPETILDAINMENHFHNDIRQVLFEYSNHNDNHGRCLYVVNKRNYLFTITALPKMLTTLVYNHIGIETISTSQRTTGSCKELKLMIDANQLDRKFSNLISSALGQLEFQSLKPYTAELKFLVQIYLWYKKLYQNDSSIGLEIYKLLGKIHTSIGSSYLHRELLWQSLSQVLTYTLPILYNMKWIRNNIQKLVAMKQSIGTSTNDVEANSCHLCKRPPINANQFLNCCHVYCHYCIMSHLIRNDSFLCSKCNVSVRSSEELSSRFMLLFLSISCNYKLKLFLT
ncbi:hypothetical protein BLOT_008312 [Blomia tropicalis]|nr:hypothetical protein BLOT_008312 [Blomia tropicalis]